MQVERVESRSARRSVVDRISESMARIHRLRERTFSQIQAVVPGVLDPPIFVCLSKLAAVGPMRSGALAEAVWSDPSTVSRHVAVLVERGLVRREADPNDGRISVLAATDQGLAVATAARQRRSAVFEKVMTGWSGDDRERFAELLERFVDG